MPEFKGKNLEAAEMAGLATWRFYLMLAAFGVSMLVLGMTATALANLDRQYALEDRV